MNLILVTMVKNESRILSRLLKSVFGVCDAVIVADTGSTDTTVEVAKKFFELTSMPGSVLTFPFESFGKSRTKSFQAAQDWIHQVGWNPSETWALLLDADMMLPDELGPVLKGFIGGVSSDIAGVGLKQANGSLVYSNIRLIRCSEPWICKGATHEAWICPPGKKTVNFDCVPLNDLNDGGCKADKYERDERLLLQDLKEMPNDSRTLYYLGQTYYCMKKWKKGIETFKKRIQVGGWDEETYIAKLHLGDCYMGLKKEGKAVATWLEAWESRPQRTETPMRLISHYRNKPNAQMTAYMFLEKLWECQRGEAIGGETRSEAYAGKNQDYLFVNQRNLDFHIWEELMILGFYKGNKRAVGLRLDEYDLTNHLNWHDFNRLFGFLKWYDWKLKPKSLQKIQIPLERLPWREEKEGSAWQPFNPSIREAPDGSGYWMNLRYANYWTEEAKWYKYRAFEGKVLTRNCFCKVEADGRWNEPTELEEIVVDPAIPKLAEHYIQGIEDCRFIQGAGGPEFLGTSQSYSKDGTNKIFKVERASGSGGGSGSGSGSDSGSGLWSVRQLPLPPGTNPANTQKNWMGFVDSRGRSLYVFGYSPFTVCDVETGIIVVNQPTGLKEYRGSAGPVVLPSGWGVSEEKYLMVIHKVQIGDDGRRYYHRFMTLDSKMRPSRLSCLVRMTDKKVEYWSGMCPSLTKDAVWISFGLNDSEAWMAEMSFEEIEKLLFYKFEEDGVKGCVAFRERIGRVL